MILREIITFRNKKEACRFTPATYGPDLKSRNASRDKKYKFLYAKKEACRFTPAAHGPDLKAANTQKKLQFPEQETAICKLINNQPFPSIRRELRVLR